MFVRPFLTGTLAASAMLIASAILVVPLGQAPQAQESTVLRGKAAFGSWQDDAPGKRRHIAASDLPFKPRRTRSKPVSVS